MPEGKGTLEEIMITDLSRGKAGKVLLMYTLPLFGSVVFQQLYNIADSVIAGRACGEDALAAIGASYPITAIFMAFAFGLNGGASVIISRLFGAGKKRDLATAVSTSYIISGAVCLALTLIGTIFAGGMLEALDTPQNIMAQGAAYLRIYTLGMPFVFLYNITTGVFTALGDSRTPFIFLILSSVGNIVLDILFVLIFPKTAGVAAVAWATFVTQGIACVGALIALRVRIRTATEDGAPLFSRSIARSIMIIAVPSILQNSFVSVGNLMIQSVINAHGSGVIAGYAAAIKINTFTITCFSALATAISAFASQSIGAGKPGRVKDGVKACIGLAMIIGIPVAIFNLIFAPYAIGIFLENGTGELAVAAGSAFLRIVSPFYLVVSVKIISDGALRGCGDVAAFTVATFADLLLRVVFTYLFDALWHTPSGLYIWWSWPAGWVIGTAVSLAFYLSGRWKKKVI